MRSCSSPALRATKASTTWSSWSGRRSRPGCGSGTRPIGSSPTCEGKPVGPAHTLHDAYLAADLITYPSLYEGYGNALLEAVFYGKPVVVNRYPVYVADIAPLGLSFIEIDGRDHR